MANLRKLLPACGFAIAVALVAVTSAFKDAPKTRNGAEMYTFKYNPPSTDPYSVTNVEDESRWSFDPDESCQNGNVKACTIEASQVDASDPTNPVLLSAEDITATANVAGDAHVTSTFDGTGSAVITNKSN